MHTIWTEKYRPTELSDYIGNESIKSKVKIYLESGEIPHLLLYGKAGTGKTTLAKLIIKSIECDQMKIMLIRFVIRLEIFQVVLDLVH